MVRKYLNTKLSYICFFTLRNHMKKQQLNLLVALALLFVTTTQAQHMNYSIKNGFSLGGGISFFNIKTDNFTTSQGTGFIATMFTTVDIPHKWYNASFGMQISENKFNILGTPNENGGTYEDIEYKLMAVQLGFLMHAKIIDSNLTLDIGPQLQYNGDLSLSNAQQESLYISGHSQNSLGAEDITELSKFNLNGTVGITAGIGPLKVKAQYIYGFLNTLEKLNDNLNQSTTFKGNLEMIAFSAMFTF